MQDIANYLINILPVTSQEYLDSYSYCKYLVFDTETDLIEEGENIYSHPPEFVLGAIYNGNAKIKNQAIFTNEINLRNYIDFMVGHNFIIVGHNIAFDFNSINYIPGSQALIWDTALFEYIYSGQGNTFPSLEFTAEKWLVSTTETKKLSHVSEAIKSGVSPKDIPLSDLQQYCEQDVLLTKKIFEAQISKFKCLTKPYQEMVINQMNWLRNIYTMSKNGLKLDINRINDSILKMLEEEDSLRERLTKDMSAYINSHLPSGLTLDIDINPSSNQQLSTMIFGGVLKGHSTIPDGTYKSGAKKGLAKYKKIPNNIIVTPSSSYFPTDILPQVVDSNNLEKILKAKILPPSFHNFITDILNLRDISKTRGTYFEGYSKHADVNGFIHSEMKHVGTPTGRLSSTKPNIQNLKGDD